VAKSVYGTPYDDHLNTTDFTINWWDKGVGPEQANTAATALERAFQAFRDQGWTAPVSSDHYLLWVLLDPSLGSTTGYTTEYFTDDYPQGYPVIYLNPTYAGDQAFWESLAAHELMHAFQYALREWDGSTSGESWYWEASATWGSELAAPDVDGHQYTSEWYATTADLRFDSTDNYRQYGLFVLDAWLDVEGFGPGTVHDVWDLSAHRTGQPWDQIIAEATDTPIDQVWAGFAGAYANQGLAESALYTDIPPQGDLAEGASGSVDTLGTQVWRSRLGNPMTVTAQGAVILASATGQGDAVTVGPGERLAVSGTADGSTYTLHLATPGAGDDSGDGSGPANDSGTGSFTPHDPAACGCSGGPLTPALLFWLPGLALLLRRREEP